MSEQTISHRYKKLYIKNDELIYVHYEDVKGYVHYEHAIDCTKQIYTMTKQEFYDDWKSYKGE